MAIKEGDFVKLSLYGSANGIVFDTTDEDAAKTADIHSPTAIYGPVTICVGQKHVIYRAGRGTCRQGRRCRS